jgi:hypothetical protein
LRDLPLRRLVVNSNNALRDLSVIKSLPLRSFSIDNTDTRDLSFLRGLKLEYLSANNTKISDLSTLAGVNVEMLHIDGCGQLKSLRGIRQLGVKSLTAKNITGLSDLSELKGTPLESLDITNTGVADLAALHDAPLRELIAIRTKIQTLTPLAGMKQLQTLRVSDTAISDLAVVHDLTGLRALDIGNTKVKDLKPLAGTDLEEVSADRCGDISTVAPLGSLKHLITVALPVQFQGLAKLKEVHTLRFVSFGGALPEGDELTAAIKRNQAGSVVAALESLDKAIHADPQQRLHSGDVERFSPLFPGIVHAKDHAFAFFPGRLGWTEAKHFAERLGGRLASAPDAETEELLNKTFAAKLPVSTGCWLGGFIERPKGAWQWLSGAPWKYSDWLPGEPSATVSNGVVEDRLGYWRRNAGLAPGWNDFIDASNQVIGFIIEWEN